MIIREPIQQPLADPFVKVVVDLKRGVIALGCELHSDCADELVEDGSMREDLWGANWYSEKKEIAFVSLINIRPEKNNRSMEIQIPEIRDRVEAVIKRLLIPS